MTATLAELLAELEDSPADTDPFSVETILQLAGYHGRAIAPHVRAFEHPETGHAVVLRFDRRYVLPSRVVEIVEQVRRHCGVPRRSR